MPAPKSPFSESAPPVFYAGDDREIVIYKFPENDVRFKHINRKVGFGKNLYRPEMGWGLYALEKLDEFEHVCLFTGHWMLHTELDQLKEVDKPLYDQVENYCLNWGIGTVWHHSQMSSFYKGLDESRSEDDLYRGNDELTIVPRMKSDGSGLEPMKTDVFDAGAWINGVQQKGTQKGTPNSEMKQCLLPDLNVCGTVNMKNAFSKSYCLCVVKTNSEVNAYEQLSLDYGWDPTETKPQSNVHDDKSHYTGCSYGQILEFHKIGLKAWKFFYDTNNIDILHPFKCLQPDEDYEVNTHQFVGPPVTISDIWNITKKNHRLVFVAHVSSRFPKDHVSFIQANGTSAVPTSGFECARMKTDCEYAKCSLYAADTGTEKTQFETSLNALFGNQISSYVDMFPTRNLTGLRGLSSGAEVDADSGFALFKAFYERLKLSETYF